MINKDWDDIPYTDGDCIRDEDEWNDMVDYIRHSACTDFTIYSTCPLTGQAFRFTTSGDISMIYGHEDSGKDLMITANDSDTRPRITLFGNSNIHLDTADSIIFRDTGTSFLQVYEDGTDDVIEGLTAGNDLYLKPVGLLKWGVEQTNVGSDRGELIEMKTAAGDTVYLKTYDLA